MLPLTARILALALIALPALARAEPASAFFAIEARDAQVSSDWYARTFALKEVKTIDLPQVVVRILKGPRLMVELLQHKPAFPVGSEDRLGLRKAGLEIDDFDGALRRWKGQGVRFHGKVFYDEAIGFHSTLLVDPDGNLVQVFGHSAIEPKD